MGEYRFKTTWVFTGTTAEAAWEVLKGHNYQDWWPGVHVNLLEPGDENGIGELRESIFTTKLLYKLSFHNRVTKLERPSVVEMDAYGELEGTGRYEIAQNGEQTEVVYLWYVKTTKAWMNAFAPMMKPMFAWNHGQVMDAGGRSLAKHLGATLVQASNEAVS